MSKQTLGILIKQKRESLGWTQRQFAEKLNMDQSYIGRLETGKQVGSVESLIAIAFTLGLKPGQLIDVLADVEATSLNCVEVPQQLTVKEKEQVKQFALFLLSQHN